MRHARASCLGFNSANNYEYYCAIKNIHIFKTKIKQSNMGNCSTQNSEEGLVFEITDKANHEVTVTRYTGEDDTVAIPDSFCVDGVGHAVTSIGDSAFENCVGLKSV